GLAGVGFADQPDVGDQLEFQAQAKLDAGLAGGRGARRLVRRTLEVLVSEAALAAGEDDPLAGRVQVLDQFARLVVVHQRAGGQADDQVFAVGAVALLGGAVFAVLSVPIVPAGK